MHLSDELLLMDANWLEREYERDGSNKNKIRTHHCKFVRTICMEMWYMGSSSASELSSDTQRRTCK